MAKLYAFHGDMPSNNKVALGPLLFIVHEDFVLEPQPTPQQLDEYKLHGFVRQVERADAPADAPAEEPAQPEAPPAPSYGRLNVPAMDPNVLDALLSDDDLEDEEDTESPVAALPAKADEPMASVDLKNKSVGELRKLCQDRGIKYDLSATKGKLVTLLMER